jgi:hypothetical protein
MNIFECCYKCDKRYPSCICKEYLVAKKIQDEINHKKQLESDVDRFVRNESRVRRSRRLGGIGK